MSNEMVTTLLIVLLVFGGTLLGVAIWLWRSSSPRRRKPDPAIDRLLAEREAYRYLTYNVAHDVSNPLQSILITLENLSDCSIKDEAHWRQLQSILRTEIDHLAKLTEEAKLLAQLSAPEAPIVRERVNMERLAAEVIFALGARAEREGINLVYQGTPRPPLILGDTAKLKQVLMNLTDNALKYASKDSGEVVITVTAHTRELQIKVSDNGTGMSPEQIAHVWNAPFQPRDARTRHIRGTGLGLAIVKRIVDQHQGSINIQSVLGEGTTFVVFLPLPTPLSQVNPAKTVPVET